MDKIQYIQQQAQCELARREFFYYCHVKAPDFYKEEKKYLVDQCNIMQDFLFDDTDVLIINEPPRHGKSRTASCFVEWVLGCDNRFKIMTGSYNEKLSTSFSKSIRNTIKEVKADENKIVYADIFPGTKIKYGDSAMNMWSLEGSHNNYLATSPDGSATGFGADLMILDDLIKNKKEAYNDRVLEEHWDWFTNTMYSRLEGKRKIIVIMTRWHSRDLAGRMIDWCKNENKKYKHINLKAQQPDGSMLCDEILSAKDFESIKSITSPEIVSANYQQEPIDLKGRLYSSFKTYDKLPVDKDGNSLFEGIYSYTDTADQGSDFLCMIIWGVYNHEAYILDVYYTQEAMEETEPESAQRLNKYEVNRARIESNNGGRGFARNVKRELEDLENYYTDVTWFYQGENKKARILTNATYVQNHIYYPVGWEHRWPEYYDAMNRYQREGNNEHDDAPDTTTGVAETMLLGGL